MNFSENLLGIPRIAGEAKIDVGNLVGVEIKKQKGLETQYIGGRIRILNSSDLPRLALHELLYNSAISCQYKGCYPVIEKGRTQEGNLEIRLSQEPLEILLGILKATFGKSVKPSSEQSMMSSENLLGIPKSTFGECGIHLGNLISQEIAKQKGLKTQYIGGKVVTVLNSSDLPKSFLHEILYDSSIWNECKGWYPIVEKERTQEGNLEIRLSQLTIYSESAFGTYTGNIVIQEIAKQNGLKALYNPVSQKITVLNSSDLPKSFLHEILYNSSIWNEYKDWYPVIKKERNEEGNLEIRLSQRSMSSQNLLGIPKVAFGKSGIHTGNIVSQEIAKQNGLKALYNPVSQKITVLAPDLAESVLHEILYNSSISSEYEDWHPVIEKERTKEGNLEISFTLNKPSSKQSQNSYQMEDIWDNTKEEHRRRPIWQEVDNESPISNIKREYIYESSSSYKSCFKNPSIDLKKELLDKEAIVMEKSISESLINTMGQFFNKHKMGKGVWYPDEYRNYLGECGIEMDESLSTGFANEKFFEKTGLFTFKLKDGKKASEALLSFLEGPTVADCGNATMACYYKCVLDILGEEKFNRLFSSEPFTLMIGQHGIADKECPLFSLLADYSEASKLKVEGFFGKRPLKIGEECHFSGVIWYGNKHPQGSGGGWNVIYSGDNEEGQQLFMAHGFEKPLTEREINQKFVEDYNKERTPQDELHIIQAGKPELYDSLPLRVYYTISDKEIEEAPAKFIKGFLVGSIRGLLLNKLVELKNAKNPDLLQMSEILLEQVESFNFFSK